MSNPRIYISILLVGAAMIAAAFVGLRQSSAQTSSSGLVPTGTVAVHCIGRFVVDSAGNAQLVGYFPYIANLPVPFFSGTPGEATAVFTFRSSVFQVQLIPNGSILHLLTEPLVSGATNVVSLYFNTNPSGDFTKPESFSQGQLIALFNTVRFLGTATPGGGLEAGTLNLTSSSGFTVQGQAYNLGNIIQSISMVFTGGPPVTGGFTAGPTEIPFGGYGIASDPSGASGYRVGRR